jgi:hypothetical protein
VVDQSPDDATSDIEREYTKRARWKAPRRARKRKSSPSENVPREYRTKAHHDPSGHAGGARAPNGPKTAAPGLAVRSTKCGRAESTGSAEKQAKHISTKPRKAVLPKIKVAVPMAST